MIPSRKRSETPERPITFNAAEQLGAFELAQLWSDRTAWPLSERTAYDELAELATMSVLAKWLDVAALADAEADPQVHLRAPRALGHSPLSRTLGRGHQDDGDSAAEPDDGIGVVHRVGRVVGGIRVPMDHPGNYCGCCGCCG